jgi:predicted DNA-binding transcriptional regulator YafY
MDMRYALQYGAEAEVLEPAALRVALQERLTAMALQLGLDDGESAST